MTSLQLLQVRAQYLEVELIKLAPLLDLILNKSHNEWRLQYEALKAEHLNVNQKIHILEMY